MPTVIIEVADLQKTYVMGKTQVHALRGVSLSVHQGEFCCLMGAVLVPANPPSALDRRPRSGIGW